MDTGDALFFFYLREEKERTPESYGHTEGTRPKLRSSADQNDAILIRARHNQSSPLRAAYRRGCQAWSFTSSACHLSRPCTPTQKDGRAPAALNVGIAERPEVRADPWYSYHCVGSNMSSAPELKVPCPFQ